MGIYDREYYRDDGGGWWASMAGKQATVGLMIAIGAVGVLQLFSTSPHEPDPLSAWGEFDQQAVAAGQVWRLVTPLFLIDFHSSVSNPLFRMAVTLLVLYYVGVSVESVYGTREFLSFFLAVGFLVYLGKFLAGLAGIDRDPLAAGPSGAVTAAMVLYACHHPYEIWRLFFVIPVPVWAIAGLVVGFDVFAVLKAGGGYPPLLVGGALAMLYFKQQFRFSDLLDRFSRSSGGRRSLPRLTVYRATDEDRERESVPVGPVESGRPAHAHAAPESSRPVDEHLEAKLDRVLEKVSRFGRDSLTSEETQILLRASEIYKRRRGN